MVMMKQETGYRLQALRREAVKEWILDIKKKRKEWR